jgi:NitT/TauT family transport system substrate-binding protein
MNRIVTPSRRALIRGAAAVAALAPAGIAAGKVLAQGQPRKIKLSWNANAVCLAPVVVGVHQGIFRRHGVDVDLINYSGSTDQLLEAIATGKADAGVGMALRWLKPLEQGFDVKLTAGTHGGCMRVLAPPGKGIARLEDLRGKTVAVSDMASPSKNFFSIVLKKRGIDPVTEVQWRQFPADLLGLAIEKGEAQALADGDPVAFIQEHRFGLTEIASNLSDEYQNRVCCVLGVRGSLVRDDKPTAAALTRALLEASQLTARDPDLAAGIFSKYAAASTADLSTMLKSQTHHHNPVGGDLKREIVAYTEELKLVSVIKPSTDPAKFADKIYADVLA